MQVLDLLEHQGPQVHHMQVPDHLELQDLQVRQVLRDHQAVMVVLELQDQQVHLDHLV